MDGNQSGAGTSVEIIVSEMDDDEKWEGWQVKLLALDAGDGRDAHHCECWKEGAESCDVL